MSTHSAALLTEKGKPFEVQSVATPKPGPGQVVLEVEAVALNIVDWAMATMGMMVTQYPCVLGSDVAGTVFEVGPDCPNASALAKGTRVTAFASSFYEKGNPAYGAFQKRVLVPSSAVCPVPDSVSTAEAATLGMNVLVPLSAYDQMGIARDTTAESLAAVASKTGKKQGILIWGASSGVGSMGVQTAALMGFVVYATAGASNLEYVKSLGAHRVFDYKEAGVEDAIKKAAAEDGVVLPYCYLATGDVAACQRVVQALKGDDAAVVGKVASAPLVPADKVDIDGVQVSFVQPESDPAKRTEQFEYYFNKYLPGKLVSGEIKPSPPPKVVGKGLGAISEGLNTLRGGVSATKLVIEL